MPAISARYRTNGTSGVIGESLAGLFIVETYLREPTLFTHYAAISPSLWWDDNHLAKEAVTLLAQQSDGDNNKLYLTMADEGPETETGMAMLINALQSRKGWCHSPKPALTHATIYHTVAPEALQFIFPGEGAPDPKSGFEVRCASGN